MTTTPYDRLYDHLRAGPRDHTPHGRFRDPLDDEGEPGDLRALVARVFTAPPPRPPVPRRTPGVREPLLRTET